MERSIYFPKEFNTGDEDGFLFTSTPPLEILRLIISDAATGTKGRTKVNEVARAGLPRHQPKGQFVLSYLKNKHMKEKTSDFCFN